MKIRSLIALSLLSISTVKSQDPQPYQHVTENAINTWLNNVVLYGAEPIHPCKMPVATPQICMVTVDANSLFNIIYWDKSGMDDVDYFKIYRENSFGAYDSVGFRPFDSLSEFNDLTSNPNLQKYKYKISAVDTFGVESALSLYHSTIFCDEPIEGTFVWNDYEIEGSPSPVVEFIMLRNDTIGAPWLPMDTIPSTLTTITDPTSTLFPAGEWRVRTLWSITCTPSRAGISTSRSNIRNKSMLITNIANNELKDDFFKLYPNPANNVITVEFPFTSDKQNLIIIRDASGRIVEQKTTIYNKVQFSLTGYAKGAYFIESRNSQGFKTKMFIKE